MVSFLSVCCTIMCVVLPVSSNRDVFNNHFTAYLPGVIQNVWHVPDFVTIPKDGHFINDIPFDGLVSGFPIPNDIQALLERQSSFSLRLMNPSWSEPAASNVFSKGEPLYLQVSASPGSGQQLYVESCYASSSPNPADKPVVSLIINKGCVASKESLVKFVLQKPDKVNFIVRTSSFKSSESYLHCRVFLSALGLTFVTKFCNYNKLKSRWVDLGGQTSVCDCCGRRCRSFIERGEMPVSLDLTAVVSTGPLIISDQQSPLLDGSKSNPPAKNLPSKREIMAGASFSGSSMKNNDIVNVSPWPVQPVFGGVVVVSQRLGGDLSMQLPDIMGLELNPLLEMGIHYPENPAIDLTIQHDEPFRKLKSDEGTAGTSKEVSVDEGKAYVEDVGLDNVVDDWLDIAQLYNTEGKPVVTEADYLEEPHLNFESVFDLPLNDQSTVSPAAAKLSESDEGEDVFRQAEMVFESPKGDKLSEPVLYSKLSLNQAADGSSSLRYEEQKKQSMSKQDNKIPQLEKDVEKKQKDASIKDLVSSLLNQLRRLWTME